jgi:hypothetical protein
MCRGAGGGGHKPPVGMGEGGALKLAPCDIVRHLRGHFLWLGGGGQSQRDVVGIGFDAGFDGRWLHVVGVRAVVPDVDLLPQIDTS